jgi:SAM-dependent methyltransferase
MAPDVPWAMGEVMDADAWDARYTASPNLVWTGEPNRFVVEELAGLPPGRALDLAAGEGRNAVWLAERGWRVTAVDFSQVAVARGRRLGSDRGADVTWVVADVRQYVPPPGNFDAVLVAYLHLPAGHLAGILARAVAALAPGGTLLVVGHDRVNLTDGVGGPQDPAVLYTPQEIVAELDGLSIRRAETAGRPVTVDGNPVQALDTVVVAIRSRAERAPHRLHTGSIPAAHHGATVGMSEHEGTDEGGAMRTTTRRAAILVAAGVVGLGGLAVAAPAVAGAGPFGQPTVAASNPGPGWGGGAGMGMGPGGGMGAGMGVTARDGSCGRLAVTEPQGTLTEQQKTTLAAMAQEEKLAHDLYTAFAAKYPAVVFDRIAASETRHLTTVRTLLDRYGLADPTASKPAGQFSDPAVQARYDNLLVQGQANQTAALQAGQTVEKADITDLQAALSGLTAPDVRQVYTQLLTATQHHLTAFQNWSTW